MPRYFNAADFRILRSPMHHFGAPLVTTPHILSQVSDLTDLSGPERIRVRALLRKIVLEVLKERYDKARDLVEHPLYARLGLGDASVASVCALGVLVLTADAQLHVDLSASGLDSINFNHIRPLGWG